MDDEQKIADEDTTERDLIQLELVLTKAAQTVKNVKNEVCSVNCTSKFQYRNQSLTNIKNFVE